MRNLKNEGVPDEKIIFAGNVMIDTLHRPSNVDSKETLVPIWGALSEISQ